MIRTASNHSSRVKALAMVILIWIAIDGGILSRGADPGDRTAPAKEAKRFKPPSKPEQDAADKIVQSVFKVELDQANHGAADAKGALAKKLIEQASDTAGDPTGRFVLLVKAGELAAAAGDVVTAMVAIDRLAARFEIDAPAERFVTLSAAMKNLRTADAQQAALNAALAAIDEAILADSYELALKFVRLASGMAVKQHNAQLVVQLKPRPAVIEQLKKEFAKAVEATDKLNANPDDAEASYVVGFYEGPLKGNFPLALGYLAKGSDSSLRDLATNELAEPKDATEQAKLADGWWNIAEGQREPAKNHLRAHAAEWYRRADPSLKGFAKLQADARIKQFESDHSLAAPAKSAIIKLLTDGDWHITWFKSKTEYSGPAISEYSSVKFNPDGTCTTSFAKGNWKFVDANSIEVTYVNYTQDYLQRFHLIGDSLRCEHYNPHDVLQNLGLGTKNPAH